MPEGSGRKINNNKPCDASGRKRRVRARGALAALAAGAAAWLAGCQVGAPQKPSAQADLPVLPIPEAAAAEPIAQPGIPVLTLVQGPPLTLVPPQFEEPDLLERLRGQLALPKSAEPAVERELAWFASHPEYLDRVFTRAERYLYHILEELERRGMPADLALLPIVESAYDPFAYSHGRAAGLWQIIPGTARRLGLRQNWWYDGRRDVIESTRAALDYLEQLHRQFDGDWLLAVAGYNSGEGNVARALRRATGADQPTDFWHIARYLPAETRTYVPRLLAIAELAADPLAHGVALPALDDRRHFAVIETAGQIDMALAAELAGVSTDELYRLNPGVNRWATDPDGPHRLLVPAGRAERFAAAVRSLGERERVQWTRHRIRQGESLIGLAQHYQTTPTVLRQVNGLSNNTIHAGEHLMIPHAVKSLATYTQSVEARTERRQGQSREGERRAHVVRHGESLWAISRHYGVGVRELASWNAMAPGDVLSVGRELVVWSARPALGAEPGAQIRRVNYVVRRGDSLYSIASRFRVSVSKLVQWNNISPNRYLQPGQRLVMYVDVTAQSS